MYDKDSKIFWGWTLDTSVKVRLSHNSAAEDEWVFTA